MANRPNILTFYSFKGGVGRTMALVNCAYALAASGRNVLVMDMDLEAPGLSSFLVDRKEVTYTNKSDILTLIEWAKGLVGKPGVDLEFLRTKSPPLANFIASVDPKKLIQPKLGTVGRLDILPARNDQDTYIKTLEDLKLPALSRDELCELSDILRGYLKTRTFTIPVPAYYGPDVETQHTYDYVLVDSRTGLTEIGGLCVGPLADCLVILLSLNHQNVQGTADFLRTIGYPDAQKAKPIIVVPSPVPVGEMKAKTKRINILKKALKVDETADPLTYHPSMAIIESIFVRDNPDEYLSFEYEKLTDRLLAQFQDEPSQLAESSWKHLNNKKYREAIDKALRIVVRNPGVGVTTLAAISNACGTPEGDIYTTLDNDGFVAMDRLCRVLADEKMSGAGREYVLANWGKVLLSCADTSTSKLKELRLAQAIAVCSTGINMPDVADEVKADTYVNRGVAKRKSGDTEGGISDYTVVINMPDAPPKQKAQAYYNRGVTRGESDDSEGAIQDYTAVINMPDAPPKQKAQAYYNRGVTRDESGDSEGAIQDYTAVINMPDAPTEQKAKAYVNRGVAKGESGDTEGKMQDCTVVIDMPDPPTELKVKAYVNRGVAKGESGDTEGKMQDCMAVIDMPDAPPELKATAHSNLGWAYCEEGRFEESIEESQKALEFGADKIIARNNLGLALIASGQPARGLDEYRTLLATADDPGELERVAVEDLQKAIEKYPDVPEFKTALDMVQARITELRAE